MKKNRSVFSGFGILVAASALTFALAGCSGSSGSAGAPGPGVASPAAATVLNMTITGATISSPPVVNFTVTNQDGAAIAGLTLADLRFTIAKLVPGSNGTSSKWQNYINTASSGLSGGYVRGNRENNGTLVDNKDGTYTYTFKTDITDTAQTCPASPCIDADGNTIDTSYNANLTHRVAVQTRGTLPMVNAVYTFKPGSGPVTSGREIVMTAKCNECHNKLQAHDARIETQYCVTCHNPGSTGKGQVGSVVGPTPVDFKVMIHKIHHGDALPSVVAGGDYGIFGFSGTLTSFKEVAFPQDIRNCTKCHDGTDTAQGDNWKSQPSKAACSSCHDDLYFGTSPTKSYQTVSHIEKAAAHTPPVTVGPDPTDDMCISCHISGGQAGGIAEAHAITAKLARGNFKFNILEICGVPVAANGTANTFGVTGCQAGQTPTVKFSVTDPTGATTHGYGNKYNIFADPEFWNSGAGSAAGSMSVDIAWNTSDYTNTDGSQARPGRANQFSVFGGTTSAPYGQAAGFTTTAATNNGDGTFTLTAATPIPATATGSGAVALEGRAFSVVPDPGLSGSSASRIPIKGEVAYFAITDSTPKARRVAVDAISKCDKCHDQLSLHGGNRNDNVQLCVLCHNPSNTDAQASGRPKAANHLPIGDDPTALAALVPPGTAPADGKKEESVDMKRMIHGIHAGEMREKSINVAGTGFSFTFPGILSDCSSCHVGTSYQLTGTWETPTQNSILGSTIDSVPFSTTGITTASASAAVDAELNNPANDLKISPTAAVCSSCHDTTLQKTHMILNGALFASMQSVISGNYETCAVCHGPGAIADVKVVHNVP